MAHPNISYQEIRFDVKDGQMTHCYILLDDLSEGVKPGIRSWRYKAFPASMTVLDIVQAWYDGREQPLSWPQKSPNCAL